jgi:hypothetical protein
MAAPSTGIERAPKARRMVPALSVAEYWGPVDAVGGSFAERTAPGGSRPASQSRQSTAGPWCWGDSRGASVVELGGVGTQPIQLVTQVNSRLAFRIALIGGRGTRQRENEVVKGPKAEDTDTSVRAMAGRVRISERRSDDA